MILLDLKLTLLVGMALLLALAGGSAWLLQRRRDSHDDVARRALYDRLPLAVVVYDSGGAEVITNAPAQQWFNVNGAELRLILRRIAQRAGDESPTALLSGTLHQPYALRWWRVPLDGDYTLLAFADWSDQQRLMRQQQAFIGQLAHELRTPLTALTAHIEIARSDHSSDTVRESSLATIQRETQRMARLVRDLLELHRLETAGDLTLRATDIVLVAEDAIAQLILLAEARGLQLTFETDAHLPPVMAEPDRLKQVFLNLLDNAVKYCRPGDQILVTLRALPHGVHCMIKDTGPGIAASHLPHVTERLYRGRADSEGTGIGLALVQEILRQHHTTLTIESVADGPATSTTCAWTLPYADPESTVRQDRQPAVLAT